MSSSAPISLCGRLDEFSEGRLGEREYQEFCQHLVTCDECERGLTEIALRDALIADAKEQQPERFRALSRRRAPFISFKVAVATAPFLAAAAMLAVLWVPSALRSPVALGPAALPLLQNRKILALGDTRPIELRLTPPDADTYQKYDTALGASAAAQDFDWEVAGNLEKQKDYHGYHTLAAALLRRREPKEALIELDRATQAVAGNDPQRERKLRDVQSDRAAARIQSGDIEGALGLLDAVLRQKPDHRQALWNRGLALSEIKLSLSASDSFRKLAEIDRGGWRSEAAERQARLREPVESVRLSWNAAKRESARMVAGGPPLSLETVKTFPGISRVQLYNAVRVARSRDRITALMPIAVALDHHAGGAVLQTYLKRIAGSDFARRRPAAEAYQALIAGNLSPAMVDQKLAIIRHAQQPDILFGALVQNDHPEDFQGEMRELAALMKDPWMTVIAQSEKAASEQARGAMLDAEQTLLDAIGTCAKSGIEYRCSLLEDQLATLYTKLHKMVEAEAHAKAGLRYATLGSENGTQVRLLQTMAQIAIFRRSLPLARAYLDEALLREPEDCETRRFIGMRKASIDVLEFDFAAARRTIDATPRCNHTLPLTGQIVLADLARVERKSSELATGNADLAALREKASPGEQILIDMVRGQLTLPYEPAHGQALLRLTIAEADRRESELRRDAEVRSRRAGSPQPAEQDVDAARARAQSFSALVADAANDRHFDQALALMAQEVRTTAPDSCALGIAVDVEREVVAARGADKAVLGDSRIRTEGSELDTAHFVPERIRAALKSCATIAVFARPPLQGAADVLPADFAWSYRVGSRLAVGTPARNASARRVVVTDIDIPETLRGRLPPTGSWSPPDDGVPTLVLRGADANPSRVLEEIEDASEIDFHAHGLVDLGFSDVSHLVLSQGPNGQYALTAGEVRSRQLRGAPLVILGACEAAHTAPYIHEAWSLPMAFIEAGASAVLASPDEIQDAGAGPFFEAFRKRVHGGEAAARALEETRMEFMDHPGQEWTRKVLLFERPNATR